MDFLEVYWTDVYKTGHKSMLPVGKILSNNSMMKMKVNFIKCDKTRNPATGEIIDFNVYSDNLNGAPLFIIDDICSNGGTFLGLAQKLKDKGAGDLHLIVTHGEWG